MNKQGLWISENKFATFGQINQASIINDIAVRRNSTQYFTSMFGSLPDPDPILRKQGKDISIYRELLTDPKVIAVTEQRKAKTLGLEWEIDRGKSKSREAKIIEALFNDLDIEDMLDKILDAPWYGMIPFEISPKKIGNYILPVKVEAKPPEWFAFDDDNLLLFKSKNAPMGERVPDNKFILARHKPSYDNPYGIRRASSCFWPVTFKKGDVKFWLTFSEKYGIPWVVGKQPRGQGQASADNLLDLLDRMVQDAVAVIPDDSSVDVIESGSKSGSSDIFKELKIHCNDEIALAVLTETLTTEISGKGTYAASNTHRTESYDVGKTDRKIAMRFFNNLIKWIYDANFSSSTRAEFILFEEEDVDQNLADRDAILTEKLSVNFTDDYISEAYNIEKKYFTIGSPQPKTDPKSKQEFSTKPDENTTALRAESRSQQAIDDVMNSLPPALLQKQIEQTLKPVLELLNSGTEYSEVMDKLAELYPEMKTSQLENFLERAIFISEVWGRISSRAESRDE